LNEELDLSKDCLSVAIQGDLDRAVSVEVSGAVYDTARMDPNNKTTDAVLDKESKTRKDAIVNVFLSCVRLQRLYFIIRSGIMGVITGLITYAIISFFSVTNFFVLLFIGLIVFVVSLAVSRVFDKPVISISNLVLNYLDRHRRLRSLVLSRL
jgi:hypothetical protein